MNVNFPAKPACERPKNFQHRFCCRSFTTTTTTKSSILIKSICRSESSTASRFVFSEAYSFVYSLQPPIRLTVGQDNARSTALLAVAKENGLDIELVETRPPNVDLDYLKLNPLGRVPTFVGSNGFILTESIAIAIYCTFLTLPRLVFLLSR
jgi:hypothetical protein